MAGTKVSIATEEKLNMVKTLLQKEGGYMEENNFKDIISIKEDSMSDTNLSNGSLLKKIVVTFKNSLGENVTKNIICKSKRKETGPHDVTELLCAFPVETKLYGEVLPSISKLLKSKEMSGPWPQYYGTEGTNILLEDLSVSGYKMKVDRKMDFDHANISIKELGKFHAMTMVIVEQGVVDPTWFKPSIYARHLQCMIDMTESAFNGLVNSMRLHWGQEWEETAGKIAKLSENLGDKFHELWLSTKGKFEVINHGEYWLNNLLFKYDNTGKVTDMRILDFQVSHYNSPCWDLAQFLHGSLMPDLRQKHMSSLLNTYMDSLTSTLKTFDYKGQVPTLSYVEDTLVKLGLYCFLMSITAPPFMLAAAKEGVKHEDDTAGKDLLKSFHNACYQWQVVRDTTKKEVEYWVKKGLIN